MKQVFSVILAGLLALSLPITASAAETVGGGHHSITATYSELDGAATYQVDIAWGDMEFDYVTEAESVWNPDTLQYESVDAASAWVPTSEGGDAVTVTNHSNASVDVEVIYTKSENGVDGELENGCFTLESADNGVDGAAGTPTSDSARLILSTANVPNGFQAGSEDVILGTLTVSVEPVPTENVSGLIDLSQYTDGDTIQVIGSSRIEGDGSPHALILHVAHNATVVFAEGTGGVKLEAITVADGRALTLRVEGDAEHTLARGIQLGNNADVTIEGDLSRPNNRLTVTAAEGMAAIGANGGVTAGDVTIRNARVEAYGSGSSDESRNYVSGAAIGTSDASMGHIRIENSVIVAEGGFYEYISHAAAIGMGSQGGTIGDIVLQDSEITARNSGHGLASVIGAGGCRNGDTENIRGTMGNILITRTALQLSMATSGDQSYGGMIGNSNLRCVMDAGSITFTDMTQEELDAMIATWDIPSDFADFGEYVIGRGYEMRISPDQGVIGGVFVSDGNGGIVQIGDEHGYNPVEEQTR